MRQDVQLILKHGAELSNKNVWPDTDETAFREVRELAEWYQKNLSLNVSKTKELIVDYRKKRAEQAPINGPVMEQVES